MKLQGRLDVLQKKAKAALAIRHYKEAESLLQELLETQVQHFGDADTQIATTLNNLAALYEAQGRYAQAEELYHRSLAIREQLLGPDHPEVAIMLNNLAGLYRATGLGEKAESLYDRSLAVMEKIFGPRHPNTAIVRANRDAYKHTAPNKANSADAKKRRG